MVEIRIFEGPSIEEGKDITFDYNANFFLYASLELARPIAQPIGRIHTSCSNSNPPILTGVPASGVAYLDRPNAAGYFIFPDLSVRHEGYFRLSFSLYETCKEEKDFDMDQPMGDAFSGVDWRMNVKTVPFNVYSAKKFPGLMESTELSKTVANQGCRVRIRRDVRMRKRDTKSNSGRDGHDGDRARNRATSSGNGRERSQSHSSEHPSGYETDERRHTGVDSYGTPLRPVYEAPPLQQHTPMTFAGDHGAPHYAAPRHYPPLNSSYPPSPYTKTESSYSGYHSVRATPQPQDAAVTGHHHAPPPSASPYGSMDGDSRRTSYTPSHNHSSSISSQPSLAPLKIASLMSPLPPIEADTELPPVPSAAHVAIGTKRSHDAVFNQSSRPLYDGNRPVDPHFRSRGYSQTESAADHVYSRAVYSRANGNIALLAFNRFQ